MEDGQFPKPLGTGVVNAIQINLGAYVRLSSEITQREFWLPLVVFMGSDQQSSYFLAFTFSAASGLESAQTFIEGLASRYTDQQALSWGFGVLR